MAGRPMLRLWQKKELIQRNKHIYQQQNSKKDYNKQTIPNSIQDLVMTVSNNIELSNSWKTGASILTKELIQQNKHLLKMP